MKSPNSGTLRYLKNTAWLLGDKVFLLILNFLIGIYVVRHLGPENYGDLSFSLSLVAVFGSLAGFGLDSLAVRDLSREEESQAEILTTVLVLRIFGALMATVLLGITLFVLNRSTLIVMTCLVLSASYWFQAFKAAEFYFRSKVNSKGVALSSSLSGLITVILKFSFIYQGFGVLWFAGANALSEAMLYFGISLFFFKERRQVRGLPRFQFERAKKLVIEGFPMILSSLVVLIYMRVDQIMLQTMIGSEQTGIYAAAARIAEAWYFVPMILTDSLFPAIVNAKEACARLYTYRMQRLYDLMFLIAIAVAIPVSFTHDWIIDFLFGQTYLAASDVLLVYIWAGIPAALGVASTKYLVAEGLTKISFYRTALGAIGNLILNYFLIPDYGIMGAAWATVISYNLANLSIIFMKESRGQVWMMFRSIFLTHLLKKEPQRSNSAKENDSP